MLIFATLLWGSEVPFWIAKDQSTLGNAQMIEKGRSYRQETPRNLLQVRLYKPLQQIIERELRLPKRGLERFEQEFQMSFTEQQTF